MNTNTVAWFYRQTDLQFGIKSKLQASLVHLNDLARSVLFYTHFDKRTP